MFPNCSAAVSRPRVCTFIWNRFESTGVGRSASSIGGSDKFSAGSPIPNSSVVHMLRGTLRRAGSATRRHSVRHDATPLGGPL